MSTRMGYITLSRNIFAPNQCKCYRSVIADERSNMVRIMNVSYIQIFGNDFDTNPDYIRHNLSSHGKGTSSQRRQCK